MNEAVPEKTRREEYTEATRQGLLAAGRDIFAREGYQAAGIEAISRAARVTRGAFYHHFDDKKALFDAVVVAMQAEAVTRVNEKSRGQRKVWDRLFIGIDAYLDVCFEPAYRRIVIQEAPAVLGSKRFDEIEEAYPMALLMASMKALQRDGELVFEDINLLGRMVDAMICKVALMLPQAKEPQAMKARGREIIAALLAGFRPGARAKRGADKSGHASGR
ncbi:MAG TPA: helix-turn-helix domain-containing protein [Bradyrhizobium sp.]|uniref:TetR/AcrR family transcriptional regulator n=1 Tax=Bradyrhizobium sp. TaxID=376 RepID=UPI002C2ECC21|nr:helix-turn-helix domain-containing protein [Bradyrhizobium sp.]HLZ02890.1 helix-turn-helix domain-containing protein [Bradyrhizobium sp.]